MKVSSPVIPYPHGFPGLLEDYCRQIQDAKRNHSHHDQRRALFMDFYRQGFGVEPAEVELEHKVKVAQVRGYIDALFDVTILEFKTSLDRERADGLAELRLYFKSRSKPGDFIAALTDGELFEIYQWGGEDVEKIDAFALDAERPLDAYLKLDQFRPGEKKRQPGSDDIVIHFGPHSLVYRRALAGMREIFAKVEAMPEVATKFREWNRLLAKVYGAELGYADLFMTHTYMVVLSRLMVAQALFPKDDRNTEMYRGILGGGWFFNKRLPNLAEPDFFSWALNTEAEATFLALTGRIACYVAKYDFGSTEEDILKELYQGLVDPAERHDLGEYYTPDWLAELTLDRLDYRGGTLLDPSCGSGTFLMQAIRRLRALGYKKDRLVRAVTQDLSGIDVHPLAVLMAKANMLLALGSDARGYADPIRLPVFMADTLQTELDEGKGCLKVPASAGNVFHIPLATIENRADQIDEMIETMHRFAQSAAAEEFDMATVKAGFLAKFPLLQADGNGEAFFWKQNLETATRLIREKQNSIWSFILKNTYRPTFLRKRKVDYVVGNPPWLSYRYIRDEEYKDRVRKLCFDYALLDSKQRSLITQIELATVFYCHCQRHFMKLGGKIGMVLPWGAMGGAKQHEGFQRLGGFERVLDLHEVTGLFNVPCCVMIGSNAARDGEPPCEYFKGVIERRNPRWDEVKDGLRHEEAGLAFVEHQIRSPWYRKIAMQGATIVPRSFWFVERDPEAYDDPREPWLQTSRDAIKDAKRPWNASDVRLKGQIDRDYLFYTVIAKGLLPFGIREVEPVFLPIKDSARGVEMLDLNAMGGVGHIAAVNWLFQCEKLWKKHARGSGGKGTARAWINYNQKLTAQSLRTKYLVLYNTSGTNLTAAVHRRGQFRKAKTIPVHGFIAEATTYRIDTSSLVHADYLCAVLNSSIVMEAIKETMPRGLLGERHIHRRPFEACKIPPFDPENALHLQIAALGEACRKKADVLAPKIEGQVGRARLAMRAALAAELHEINKLAAILLHDGARPKAKPRAFSKDKNEFFA
jgi:hypothetical protein